MWHKKSYYDTEGPKNPLNMPKAVRKFYCTACTLALLVMIIFAPAVPAAEQTSSKPASGTAAIHPWAGFNPGSWVEIKSTSVNKSARKEETNITGTKITLLEKTADKVFLENEVTVKGQTTKTKFDLSLKGYSDAELDGMTVLKTGSETITIAGKSVACDTLEASMNLGGQDPFQEMDLRASSGIAGQECHFK